MAILYTVSGSCTSFSRKNFRPISRQNSCALRAKIGTNRSAARRLGLLRAPERGGAHEKSGSQQLLAKQRLPRASVRLHGLGECLLLLGSGFLTAGAQIGGLALPLGACLTASLPFGRRSLSAALGAAAGYALLCEPAMAAERIALTALLLAAIVVFQGTTLPATRWFLPAMAAGTAPCARQPAGLRRERRVAARPAVAHGQRGGRCGDGRPALRDRSGERGRPLYFAALLSGLSGLTALGLPADPGLIGGCAMVYGAPELSAVCAAAAALGLTGNLGWSVTAALLLPAVTARVVRSDLARALLGGALCCGVLWLGGVGTPAAFAAVGIGIPLGLWLRRTGALRASGPAAAGGAGCAPHGGCGAGARAAAGSAPGAGARPERGGQRL